MHAPSLYARGSQAQHRLAKCRKQCASSVVCAAKRAKAKTNKPKDRVSPLATDFKKGFRFTPQESEYIQLLEGVQEKSKHAKEAEELAKERAAPSASQQYESESNFNLLYTDAAYVPPDWTSPALELVDEGQHTTYRVAKSARVKPHDILFVARAALYTEFPMTEIPEPHALLAHTEANPPAPEVRRALSTLACTAPGYSRQPAVSKNLDFSLACSEASVPPLDSETLLTLIAQNMHSDQSHDIALLALRKERARGFAGVWLPRALMRHSCAPNTFAVFVGDTMVVRATEAIEEGGDVTANKIQGYAGCPLEVRQQLLRRMGFSSKCRRDEFEADAPQAVRDLLLELHTQYLPRQSAVGAALERGDMAGVLAVQRPLLAGLKQLEEAVDRAVSDPQERLWLLGSALKSYELLVALIKLLGPTARAAGAKPQDARWLLSSLDIMAEILPGSDEHVMTAVEGMKLLESSFEDMKQRKPSTVKRLSRHISDAIIARYGDVGSTITGKLVKVMMTARTALDAYSGGSAAAAVRLGGAFDTEEVENWVDSTTAARAGREDAADAADAGADLGEGGEEEYNYEEDEEEEEEDDGVVDAEVVKEGVSAELLRRLEEEQREALLL